MSAGAIAVLINCNCKYDVQADFGKTVILVSSVNVTLHGKFTKPLSLQRCWSSSPSQDTPGNNGADDTDTVPPFQEACTI